MGWCNHLVVASIDKGFGVILCPPPPFARVLRRGRRRSGCAQAWGESRRARGALNGDRPASRPPGGVQKGRCLNEAIPYVKLVKCGYRSCIRSLTQYTSIARLSCTSRGRHILRAFGHSPRRGRLPGPMPGAPLRSPALRARGRPPGVANLSCGESLRRSSIVWRFHRGEPAPLASPHSFCLILRPLRGESAPHHGNFAAAL